ncbi:hypothetical protein VOLCADRAFT_103330 [Volvox carteri f. nagariensis]|uniref:Uncharacterized protein n=1 Tax=Volvox carteri f. nagariensis TaxID=3068 RepID=D8TL99_VOLCA|nr:uncharacterized protein VOLCADRAFT_103330 [Volvox carteri f. nagariensis]EFJ51699.1 hypothetical protein VOLCADRAFT_103330 [Volvox carteri f. nagariensis]|eukprot:XP_002947109.1 hypothetical protein VOLCADRAFT_103330 [Volvox carteri f. nagariensis]
MKAYNVACKTGRLKRLREEEAFRTSDSKKHNTCCLAPFCNLLSNNIQALETWAAASQGPPYLSSPFAQMCPVVLCRENSSYIVPKKPGANFAVRMRACDSQNAPVQVYINFLEVQLGNGVVFRLQALVVSNYRLGNHNQAPARLSLNPEPQA